MMKDRKKKTIKEIKFKTSMTHKGLEASEGFLQVSRLLHEGQDCTIAELQLLKQLRKLLHEEVESHLWGEAR